jgi:hypothetical protein
VRRVVLKNLVSNYGGTVNTKEGSTHSSMVKLVLAMRTLELLKDKNATFEAINLAERAVQYRAKIVRYLVLNYALNSLQSNPNAKQALIKSREESR